MKLHNYSELLALLLVFGANNLHAQARDFHAQRIVLDDGSGHNLTLQAPSLGSSQTFTLPSTGGTLASTSDVAGTSLSGEVTGTLGATTIGTSSAAGNHIVGALNNASTSINNNAIDITVRNMTASQGMFASVGTAASNNSGVSVPSTNTAFVITNGSASHSFSLNLPTGSNGRMIYVINEDPNTANGPSSHNIAPHTSEVFVYTGGGLALTFSDRSNTLSLSRRSLLADASIIFCPRRVVGQ